MSDLDSNQITNNNRVWTRTRKGSDIWWDSEDDNRKFSFVNGVWKMKINFTSVWFECLLPAIEMWYQRRLELEK